MTPSPAFGATQMFWISTESKDITRVPLPSTPVNTMLNSLLGTQEVDDMERLCQSYFSRDAEPARHQQILDFYGVRWTPLNLISDWLPSRRTALDFMHNIFLGEFHLIIDQARF